VIAFLTRLGCRRRRRDADLRGNITGVWVVLIPSGVPWLDAEIGGLPAKGVVAALGSSGAGKTSLALGFTVNALARGRTCFVTSDTPEAVIETSRTMLELDLRPSIAGGALCLVAFAPFFTHKVKSLHSVDAPFAELKGLLAERRIEHVVFDTIDPLLTWIDPAIATAVVRNMMGQMRSWGVSVLCTTSGAAPACAELARTASGSVELRPGKIRVDHAGWCNVYGAEAPCDFVQGRGFVVRGPTARGNLGRPVRAAPVGLQSLIGDSRAYAQGRQPAPSPAAHSTPAPRFGPRQLPPVHAQPLILVPDEDSDEGVPDSRAPTVSAPPLHPHHHGRR
jgi:KaiC/GvpD/RAD55 family RecA-like ATPase